MEAIIAIDSILSIKSTEDFNNIIKQFKSGRNGIYNKIYKCDDYQRLEELKESISPSSMLHSTPREEKEFEKIIKKLVEGNMSSAEVIELGKSLSSVGMEHDDSSLKDHGHGLSNRNFKAVGKVYNMGEGHEIEELNALKSSVVRKIQAVFMKIAKEMDPKPRAGETKEHNERDAEIRGRESSSHHHHHGFFHAVMKMVKLAVALNDVSDLVDDKLLAEGIKGLKHKDEHKNKNWHRSTKRDEKHRSHNSGIMM